MKIDNCKIYQNFKAQMNNDSFLDKFSYGLSETINNTAKASEDFSDIIISTKNALSSPEEATIGILKEQIEDKVVNNEKAPSWLRKTAIYGAAALVAGSTFFATIKVPNVAKKFVSNLLNKSERGTKILGSLVSFKHSVSKIANNFGLEPIKKGLGKINNFVTEKLPQKITSKLQRLAEYTKIDKLKNWAAEDYAKNIIAIVLGYKTGKKFLNKHQNKLIAAESIQQQKDNLSNAEISVATA